MRDLVRFLTDRFLPDHRPGGMVQRGHQEHTPAATILGSPDLFPINGDHPPGRGLGVGFTSARLRPFADHGIQNLSIDAGDHPMESGQRRDPGARWEALSRRGFPRPFGDHGQRSGPADHRTHDDVQQVQERVTHSAPVARIRHRLYRKVACEGVRERR